MRSHSPRGPRLSVARCGRLDRVADVGSGVEPPNVIEAGCLDDVFERTAGLDRVADSAATDGQARDAFWRLGREEERGALARALDGRNILPLPPVVEYRTTGPGISLAPRSSDVCWPPRQARDGTGRHLVVQLMA
jgi:hypothetical protein